jgi:hypothetical protein
VRRQRRKKDSLGDSSGVDEDIDMSIVVSGILDGLLNGLGITNVDLVEANVDTSLGGKFAGRLFTELLLDVEDGNALDADLRESLRHVVAKSAATTVM